MTLRFLADANVDPAIVRGLRRREPSIDILAAQGVLADGVDDLSVLQIAAQDQRVLVSRDVRTMPGYFREFIDGNDSPGLILVPRGFSTAEIIEALLLVWLAWLPVDLHNQIRWLPR